MVMSCHGILKMIRRLRLIPVPIPFLCHSYSTVIVTVSWIVSPDDRDRDPRHRPEGCRFQLAESGRVLHTVCSERERAAHHILTTYFSAHKCSIWVYISNGTFCNFFKVNFRQVKGWHFAAHFPFLGWTRLLKITGWLDRSYWRRNSSAVRNHMICIYDIFEIVKWFSESKTQHHLRVSLTVLGIP